MQKITTSLDLKNAIQELEFQQAQEWPLVKEQFFIVYENTKPLTIIKNTIKNALLGPDLTTTAVNAAVGLATGFITKKIVIGSTANPLLKFAGLILEMVVANKVNENSEGLKSIGIKLLKKILPDNK